MVKEISTIITLYKTPNNKIKSLVRYKNYNLLLFNQDSLNEDKEKIKKILKFDFKYFNSKKNIGLAKSSNFLLSKVKTKYCLFTQPDIYIQKNSILNLLKIIKQKKDAIFVAPSYLKNLKEKKLEERKKINAACMICDVEKLNKIGFFDEDFFLYWEDIFLMNKINKTKYKMYIAHHVKAKHEVSKSSENALKTDYLRISNFIYGELLYDYKLSKLRYIKVLRKLFQNFLLFFLYLGSLQFKKTFICTSKLIGILKFLNFRIFN